MSPKLPPPPQPDFGDKPRGTWWTIALAGLALLFVMTLLSFLTLGYFAPVVFLGLGVFALIGVQYLVWGWFFERIYRQGREHVDD